jgi:adenine-specific DNA-methyltransferase
MAKKATKNSQKDIESYQHKDKDRVNNPPVGLVTPDTDQDTGKKTYSYDPHLDPQLVWTGKAEHTSFDVPTVSLHVHERIDPHTIIHAVRKKSEPKQRQRSLFDLLEENPPMREAIEFYKHKHNWSNRLIAGDSLLVMNSLLEKEGLGGQVQMVYIDPPYGIRYGSNFQPFVNKRDVREGKDEDLTQEPEMIRAFRDTWELGIHSYLTYLRDRLLLARELLHESGSCFVQISDENLHHVRELMDEVFGKVNFCRIILYRKTGYASSSFLPSICDYIVWYAKDIYKLKYRQIYSTKSIENIDTRFFDTLEYEDKKRRPLTKEESKNPALIPSSAKLLARNPFVSPGWSENLSQPIQFNDEKYYCPPGAHWKTTQEGISKLKLANRIIKKGNTLRYVHYLEDFPISPRTNYWGDTGTGGFSGDQKVYVVQTDRRPVVRCLIMTTDPGDLVFDPTCGSGTTAYVAEQWGRRWITCDTSRVALTLAKQRLMTASFDYYKLARPEEGVGSGFEYKTVPHITLKSIANNPEIKEGMSQKEIDEAIQRHAPQETLYDQPYIDKSKSRVTGPFTVEAVPSPTVKPLGYIEDDASEPADESIARSGETARQGEWRDELLKTGIRGKAGQRITFSRIEPLAGTRWLHAEGETKPNDEGADSVREEQAGTKPERVVISFGPEHAPLEQRQVDLAIEEAQTLVPKPKIIVFAAFQFDPEAAKDIDEINWPGVTLIKAQMSADLLTDDLKKKRASNESFWLIGQPDVLVEKAGKGKQTNKYKVSVHGFDYYNTKTGNIESGGKDKIAMWLLDPDYDGRSLFPRQVFFPMAGSKDGWSKLARNLKAEIDQELIEAYRGTKSLPFESGKHKRAAVKIIDDRGIESFKIIGLE